MDLLRKLNRSLTFIHPGIRFRILKLFVRILGWSSKDFEVPFYGFKYRGQLSNHIDFMTFFFGCYEKGILSYLQKNVLTPEMTVLDVGANIGHHSLFFASQSKKVLSFEPYQKVRFLLEDKLRVNQLSHVQIVPLGLSSSDQELNYFEPLDENTGTGSFIQEHSAQNNQHGLKLQLVNGDTFLDSQQLKKVDFIKIDVEGFEHFVLQGLKQTLLRDRPTILLEFNTATQEYCKTVEGFMDLLPPQYGVQRLANVFGELATLEKFDFSRAGDVNLICRPL